MELTLKNDLIRAILSLSPLDRIEIVDSVINGLTDSKSREIEKLWAEESERRVSAFLDGSIKYKPVEEVFNRINSSQ